MKLLFILTLGALVALAAAVPKPDIFDPLAPRTELDISNCGNCMDALNDCYQAHGCWNTFVGGFAYQSNCLSMCKEAICFPCPSCSGAIGGC